MYPLQAISSERRRRTGRVSNAFGASAVLTMPACIVIAAGVVLPLAYMLILSVQAPDPGEVELTANFTAANYLKFFTSPFYWSVLLKTIWVASVTTALCAFLGLTLAVSIWLTSSRWRGLCIIAVISPLLVSIVTRAFGWMVVLGDVFSNFHIRFCFRSFFQLIERIYYRIAKPFPYLRYDRMHVALVQNYVFSSKFFIISWYIAKAGCRI